MGRIYIPSTPATRGEAEPDEAVEPEIPETPTGDEIPEVPAESEKREVLEQFAVEHAGLTEEEATGFPNKGELHAAIVAAVETLNS